MKEVKQVKTGELNPQGVDSVFIAFVSSIRLNEKYGELEGREVPVMLMQGRWSGDFGFPGGKVDPGENLKEAMLREVKEETGYESLSDGFELLCSHQFETKPGKTMNTHLYIKHENIETLKQIASSTLQAEDFIQENLGNIIVPLADYGQKGINKFLKNQLASTVKEEIEVLIEYLKNKPL